MINTQLERNEMDMGEKSDKNATVDIEETAKSLLIKIQIPNLMENSIYIEVTGHLLLIKGEQYADESTRDGIDFIYDKQPKIFQRYIILPKIISPQNINAKLKGNIVNINISK